VIHKVRLALRPVGGHGTFNNEGSEVSFNLSATQSGDGSMLGYFSFCDPAGDICRRLGKIRILSLNGNTAEFSGHGHLEDGSSVTFHVNMTDNGWPGTSDTISISGDIRIF
jgi:hypothetical protein